MRVTTLAFLGLALLLLAPGPADAWGLKKESKEAAKEAVQSEDAVEDSHFW